MKGQDCCWYKNTNLGDECSPDTHCANCELNGNCEACSTIDGQFTDEVFTHASTCDGCHELTDNAEMLMDGDQLGYCPKCVSKMSPEEQSRLIILNSQQFTP
jgi:hypothetical protein